MSERQDIKMEEATTAPVEPFPFMRLPPEVRNMVYKEALVMPGIISIERGLVSFYYARLEVVRNKIGSEIDLKIDQKSTRALLQTSKTVYQEASPVYFGSNHFYFDDVDLLTRFLQTLRPDFRRLITQMTVHYYGRAPAKAMKALSGCISLTQLTLELSVLTAYCMTQKSAGVMTLMGLKDLLKIRGLQDVNIGTSRINLQEAPMGYLAEITIQGDTLQVLKEPHNPIKLKRLEAKDYPKGKSQRTIFGKANVITRAERKIMGEQKSS